MPPASGIPAFSPAFRRSSGFRPFLRHFLRHFTDPPSAGRGQAAEADVRVSRRHGVQHSSPRVIIERGQVLDKVTLEVMVTGFRGFSPRCCRWPSAKPQPPSTKRTSTTIRTSPAPAQVAMGFSTIVAAWFQPEESTGSRTGAIHLTVQTPTGPPLKIDAMPGDTLAVLRARIAAHGFAPERQCLTVDGVAIESWTYKRWCQKVVPGALLQLSDAQEQSQLLLHATEAAKKVAVDALHAHTEAMVAVVVHEAETKFTTETVGGGLQLRRPDGTAKHFRHFIAKWDETRGCWAVTWGKNKSGKNRRSRWASCASAPLKVRYVTGASDWPDGPAEYGFLLLAASGEPDLAVAASTASDKERWLRELDPAGAAVRVADKKKLADLETACITARNTYDAAERAFKEAIAEAEAFEASRVRPGVAEANNAQTFVVEIEPLLLKMEGQLRAKEWQGALVAMGKAKDRASAIKFRRHDLSDQQDCASSPWLFLRHPGIRPDSGLSSGFSSGISPARHRRGGGRLPGRTCESHAGTGCSTHTHA